MNNNFQLQKTLRLVIYTQCAGAASMLLVQNGFVLTYSLQLGIPPYGILLLFSMLSLIGMVLTLPLAYVSDRFGKKRVGQTMKFNVLASQWDLGRLSLSSYDTVLLGSAVLMLLSSVTLGLVPSVLNIRSQSIPTPRR